MGRKPFDWEFITNDTSTIELLNTADRAATTDVPVLIQGESGTGKELIARRIHDLSFRIEKSLVSINCGAIHGNLLISELFGYEKGAFTGALTRKKGLVEMAHGGTLFLDEIGDLEISAQVKLLRFLQEGEVYRIGGKGPIKVDVRIISATNKSLESLIKEGKFRRDLFYRINTVNLKLLPLRQREEDPLLLAMHFIKDEAHYSHRAKKFSQCSIDLIRHYPWPGNVRELQNTIEYLKLFVEQDIIEASDFPASIRNYKSEEVNNEPPPSLLLSQVERCHIMKVLKRFNGNKTKAANAMGITSRTLHNKLLQYRVE